MSHLDLNENTLIDMGSDYTNSQSKSIGAVIFDRNGIIIDTEALVIDSARKAFKELGFVMPDSDIPQIIGRSSTVYIEYFLHKWKFDPQEFYEISHEFFYKNLDSAPFFVETIKLIKKLYAKEIPLAITTSASKKGTLLILKTKNIEHMFKVIITREDCSKLKPDPEPYMLTAKRLGIDPVLCVAIEDTSLGVESAKKAGMWCIAVPNDFTQGQDFSKADYVVRSSKEINIILDLIWLQLDKLKKQT